MSLWSQEILDMATNWKVHLMLSFPHLLFQFINLFLIWIPQLSLCIVPLILLLSFLRLAPGGGSCNKRKSRRGLSTACLLVSNQH